MSMKAAYHRCLDMIYRIRGIFFALSGRKGETTSRYAASTLSIWLRPPYCMMRLLKSLFLLALIRHLFRPLLPKA